jgi:hypothetical protein
MLSMNLPTIFFLRKNFPADSSGDRLKDMLCHPLASVKEKIIFPAVQFLRRSVGVITANAQGIGGASPEGAACSLRLASRPQGMERSGTPESPVLPAGQDAPELTEPNRKTTLLLL